MALTVWEWNLWFDELEKGNGDCLLDGLNKTVRSHALIRVKKLSQIREEYGAESHEELAQELAIRVLSDSEIMGRHHRLLGNTEIGRRINRTLTNYLTDRWRRRLLERNAFVDKRMWSDQQGTEFGLDQFLARRVSDLGNSPEGQCILLELIQNFRETLTPREQEIFDAYQEFGEGDLSLKELVEALGLRKTILYKTIKQIKSRLGKVLEHRQDDEVRKRFRTVDSHSKDKTAKSQTNIPNAGRHR